MVRSILGTKRKSSASGDLKEKPADQKRSRTADGGKKGVDYITVKSGKEREDFRIGDCILVRSEKKSMPYVGRIVSFSNYSSDLKHTRVEVSWFYRPEECKAGRMAFHGEKELFMSRHTDYIDADTINEKCDVMSISDFMELETVEDDQFYSRFAYDPATKTFSPETVPVYCLCEMPYNPDVYMISCNTCWDWYACCRMPPTRGSTSPTHPLSKDLLHITIPIRPQSCSKYLSQKLHPTVT